jgi:tryptophan-rich sensory protein
MQTAPDRLSQLIWLVLAVLGAMLAVIAWYRLVP